MDNRSGDRHLHRVGTHASGVEKRRRTKELRRKAEEAPANSRRLIDFFIRKDSSFQPQSNAVSNFKDVLLEKETECAFRAKR